MAQGSQDPQAEKAAKPEQAGQAEQPQPTGETIVTFRDEFLVDKARMVTIITGSLAAVTVLLAGLILYVLLDRPPDVYIPATTERYKTAKGNTAYRYVRVLGKPKLNEAFLNDAEALSWANHALREIYSFNFQNMDKQFAKMRTFFTEAGWARFQPVLQSDEVMNKVRVRRLVLNAQPLEPPVMDRKGLYEQYYSWLVKNRIRLDYRSSREAFRQILNVEMLIRRVPPSDTHPRGLAIESLTIKKLTRER